MMAASMAQKSYIEDTLTKRILFFTGKGGVGKSTVAWATALAATRRGKKVAVISWNPLDGEAKPQFAEKFGVDLITLDTLSCFREYALQILKFERVYSAVFDNHVLKTFILAAPGLSDTVIAGKLWDIYQHRRYDLMVVDLPSSGHTVSFFQSPLGVRSIFKVGFVHKEASKICEMFQADDSRLDIVTLPEELPMTEAGELREKLGTLLPFRFGYLHLNQLLKDLPVPSPESTGRLPDVFMECLASFRARREAEQGARARAASLGMPVLGTEKFTATTLVENIENVADHFAGATTP